MGVKVGRIVKEFVFKSLLDQAVPIEIHGTHKTLIGRLQEAGSGTITLEVLEGEPDQLAVGEILRLFFFFQNNYHTFESKVAEIQDKRLLLTHPEGVYKNLQRKYERIRLSEALEVYFTLKGEKVELNFPRMQGGSSSESPAVSERFNPDSIKRLVRDFRNKLNRLVSVNKITMMRNRIPSTYEERLMAATGKAFWVPSAEEDFPLRDPFPESRIITKKDLVKYEEAFRTPSHVILSKLGNILYEKQKKNIFSEAHVPVLHNEYFVGYIRLANTEGRREKIEREVVEFAIEFAQVLSHSLRLNGYFSDKSAGLQRYEATIVDISASGLLFAHSQESLTRDLLIHTDLDLTLRFGEKKMVIGSRIRRKFQDTDRCYFGVQFMKIELQDFQYLFELLYGKPFQPEDEERWEGGAPPPPLDLFE